ncbi:MAG: hypothetical protein ACFFBH_02015 [Promethearchaeota archaeon]
MPFQLSSSSAQTNTGYLSIVSCTGNIVNPGEEIVSGFDLGLIIGTVSAISIILLIL